MTIWILLVILTSLASRSESSFPSDLIKNQPVGNEVEIQGLIVRLLGEKEASRFEVHVDDSLKDAAGRDVVKISRKSTDEPVVIIGSSGTAAAFGFNNYLKYHLKCQVSWDGDQLSLPEFEAMPLVYYQLTMAESFRYYMNVCTFSYSYVWWNWTRWEREIDWMALNGFNLVLAFTGTEAVWYSVYRELGFTEDEIDDHFSGPAFIAWNRMGNIRGGAKLSINWHRYQEELQKKILKRMRDFGIIPVLPAFAGHLPRAIKRLYPNAEITYAARWVNFPDKYCCPAMLLPTDPLFKKIGSMFVEKLKVMYGTNHVYNCDPFNEMKPSTTDVDVLANYSKSIYSSMAAADPSAVWVLQGWFFGNNAEYWTKERSKAFLTSISPGKLIVLDLQAELNPQYSRLDNFFGRPYIWCMLHNFGGTLGLQGAIDQVQQKLLEARESEGSTIVGTGITMEGIGTNYAVYDFMTDLTIILPKNTTVNSKTWFDDYSERRYGESNQFAKLAWNLLLNSVYNYTGNEAPHGQFVFNNRPSLKKQVKYWYDPMAVASAWQLLLNAARTIKRPIDLFKHDLVDVTRQSIQHLLDQRYLKIIEAYRNRNLTIIQQESTQFLEMLDDLDKVLETDEHFLLGIWLNSAKALATTPLERRVYERDARNQISLWGPDGEILDYANKQWAGVVRDYFKPRWVVFFKYLEQAATTRGNFDNKKYQRDVFEAEKHFAYSYGEYTAVKTGDSIQVSQMLFNKWQPIM